MRDAADAAAARCCLLRLLPPITHPEMSTRHKRMIAPLLMFTRHDAHFAMIAAATREVAMPCSRMLFRVRVYHAMKSAIVYAACLLHGAAPPMRSRGAAAERAAHKMFLHCYAALRRFSV